MNDIRVQQVGSRATFSKLVSEADAALFEMVTRDELQLDEEPASLARQPRYAAPYALLAALLSAAATRLAPQDGARRLVQQHVEFSAPVYIDDVLSATTEITAYDPVRHTLGVHARCENQDGLPLAEGDFIFYAE